MPLPRLNPRLFALLSLLALATAACTAQKSRNAHPLDRLDLFGGYSFLSTGFAGANDPNFNNPHLNGWNASLALRLIAGLAVKADGTGFYGQGTKSYFAPSTANPFGIQYFSQHALVLLFGPQYSVKIRRETIFAEALFGFRRLNADYSAGVTVDPGGSFNNGANAFGGGFDTPISCHVSVRLKADYLHAAETGHGNQFHYGYPTSFASAAAGLTFHTCR